ncbi:putative PIF1 DNA helicase/replication protein A1-like protein [Tanacetum coccineum]
MTMVMQFIKGEMTEVLSGKAVVGSIKYLFKYINKGPDRVSATVDGEEVDEIKDYLNCRYVSASEAAWRIYGFDIHYRTPAVERLPFHLKDEQSVIFYASESIDYALDKSSVNETKFESWMELNKTDTFAQTLLYGDLPRFYAWNQKNRAWTKRQRGVCLGRIHHVPSSWGELYYLRAILNKIKGPMEWDDLKKVDGVLYPTYRDACHARGLLQDDKEYIDDILEARLWGMGDYLRSIFVMLTMTDSMSRPEIVWEKTWHVMAEDVLSVERKKQNDPDLKLSDTQRKNICLTYIECMLRSNNRSLKDIQNMPYTDQDYTMKGIYSTVMDAVENNKGGMFFVYGYGGTGKTYLYKTMSAALRSKGDIVLNVVSSGIAALLLEGGRMAHSRSDPSVASDKVFGGKVVLLGGDFRQILSVITTGGRQDVVNATINASYL